MPTSSLTNTYPVVFACLLTRRKLFELVYSCYDKLCLAYCCFETELEMKKLCVGLHGCTILFFCPHWLMLALWSCAHKDSPVDHLGKLKFASFCSYSTPSLLYFSLFFHSFCRWIDRLTASLWLCEAGGQVWWYKTCYCSCSVTVEVFFRSWVFLRDSISLSLKPGADLWDPVCSKRTHAGSLAAGRLTQSPCLTASCSCSGCSEPAEPAGGTLRSAVCGCWTRAAGWMRSRELWPPGRGPGKEAKSGRCSSAGRWTHTGPRSLLSPSWAALPPAACDSPGSAEVIGALRWPGQDGTDAVQAAAGCVRRLAEKPPPPLENKASGRSDWKKGDQDRNSSSSAELLPDSPRLYSDMGWVSPGLCCIDLIRLEVNMESRVWSVIVCFLLRFAPTAQTCWVDSVGFNSPLL